jgi:hypothetical protein
VRPAKKKSHKKVFVHKLLYGGTNKNVKEINECVICCEEFGASTEVGELGCDERHIFHIRCIADWL